MYCARSSVRMPRMRCRVVCALREVIATCAPTSSFRSVDLPTFGRPTIATVPVRNGSFISLPAPGRLLQLGEHDLRGRLLGSAARAALAAARHAEVVHSAFDRESLVVCLALGLLHRVARQCEAASLQMLLQRGLRVLGDRRLRRAREALLEERRHGLARGLEARIEE